MLANDRREMPGMVRASFGMYNTTAEVDVLIEALGRIARGEYAGRYEQDSRSGEYQAVGWSPNLEQYFQWQQIL
jgi:hypothetical protein